MVSAGTGDNGNWCNVSRLVAEGNAQPKREQDRKSKDPKNNLRFAFEFQKSRRKQMDEARPASVARRRGRGPRRNLAWRLLGNGHRLVLDLVSSRNVHVEAVAVFTLPSNGGL